MIHASKLAIFLFIVAAQLIAVAQETAKQDAAVSAGQQPSRELLSEPAGAADPLWPPIGGSKISVDENLCATCHSEPDLWDDQNRRLFISREILEHDVHWQKGVNCHDCHGGNHATTKVNEAHSQELGFRAKAEAIKKNCFHCHRDQATALSTGLHIKAGPKDTQGEGTLLECRQCHGQNQHQILPARDSRSPTFLDHQVQLCGDCHKKELDTYHKSVHGRGLYESGLLVTASCASCHGAHGVWTTKDERSPLHLLKVAETCGSCHRFIHDRVLAGVHGGGKGVGRLAERLAPGGQQKQTPTCTSCHQGHDVADPTSVHFRAEVSQRCGACHEDLVRRYALSMHGQLSELGHGAAAKCSDCHGAHDIFAVADARSKLSAENKVQTCAQCHPNATNNFANFDPHADHRDPKRSALLYYVYLAMEILLYSVFTFFGVHTLLWLIRSVLHRWRHGRAQRLVPGHTAYVRFAPIHRVLHVLVIVSFLGLALTGLPLRFSDQPWAKWLAFTLGGFNSTGFWHRICALITVFYFATHLVWLTGKIFQCRADKWSWKKILVGPDSTVPNLRDARDLLGMFRWFLGLGPKPTFERWTYWEKFDYWAVFWGVGIIGASGFLLWFPEFFCRLLPGETLNIAKVIHSEEALLATGFIFTIHFFNTHLRAEKFPMDMGMLTGLVTEEELEEERPELVQRLREAGKLDELRAITPSRRVLWSIMFGGFLAVAIGLALLAGILIGTF